MIRLSIIVPVYNVEKYLAKCLDSLLQQDLPPQEYEILVIDDGSPDGSHAIAEKFEREHENIRVISQKNLGLGGARNTGIDHAQGQYLMFVDSDDYIERNCISGLVEAAETNRLDLFRFGHREVIEGEPVPIVDLAEKKNGKPKISPIFTGEEFMANRMKVGCYACVLVIRTELLKKNGLYFERHRYYEDTEWFPRVLIKAQRVAECNKLIYNYVQRQGSITKSVDIKKKKKVVDDKILLVGHLQNLQKQVEHRGAKEWFDMMISHLVISIGNYAAGNLPDLLPEVLQQLKNKEGLFPLKTKRCSPGLKRNIRLANFHFAGYLQLKRAMILLRRLF